MPAEKIASLSSSETARTQEIGEVLGGLVQAGDVIVLSGDLGAGKTQLTKGIARGLGVADTVTSPTFNILLVHEGRIPLYHFDLYRLDEAHQLEDLDYFGVLEGDGVAVVEWGDRFAEAMPEDALVVVAHITGDVDRRLDITATGPRSAGLASDWVRAAGGAR